MRILLIEDEPSLAQAIKDHLMAQGEAVDWLPALLDAEDTLRSTRYDIILLDLNLPDGNGITFLQNIRKRGDVTPCVILTAQDQISDRIAGLNAGADDYLVKPFDLGEMIARLGAVSRRYSGNPNPLIEIGNLAIDQASRLVFVSGRQIDLTAREWAVFDQLLRRPGAILSKRQLEDALYEFGAEIESNTVEVYISRLRKKIGPEPIRTVRGVGYRLEG
ncbi:MULTISPECIES: response regulator transcription factor [unclassified Thalassospira]|uniref:response regulator n=1 Tax=unclassified Thalassospira TaxID=2648997 RepID=UPI000A1FB49B|nr:response regulator transcription factor [Thalassospira sp. MCCC 1A01428]OSQ43064.1 transcriptional regulator [Thalassospira sp. MCCC 1A01428]